MKYQQFNTLSKGQRQLVLIARALLQDIKLLLLDEPTAGLDIYAREKILKMLDNIQKEKKITMIYVTHYMDRLLNQDKQKIFLLKII